MLENLLFLGFILVLFQQEILFTIQTGKKERVGRLMLMHSKDREERKTVKTGEIAAMVGLKYTKTGHTLCDQSQYSI